jgi:hypothetical protein
MISSGFWAHVQLLQLKEHSGFGQERCECWSLLADVELAAGNAASAFRMCQKGMFTAEKLYAVLS